MQEIGPGRHRVPLSPADAAPDTLEPEPLIFPRRSAGLTMLPSFYSWLAANPAPGSKNPPPDFSGGFFESLKILLKYLRIIYPSPLGWRVREETLRQHTMRRTACSRLNVWQQRQTLPEILLLKPAQAI